MIDGYEEVEPGFLADNYSVYRYSSWITDINGSLDYIDTTTNEDWNFTGHSDGTWYFIVEAINEYSGTASNCVVVVVESTQPPEDFELSENADSPDHDGNFDITWNQSLYADNLICGISSLHSAPKIVADSLSFVMS